MSIIKAILHDAEVLCSKSAIPLPAEYLKTKIEIKKFQIICKELIEQANSFIQSGSNHVTNQKFLDFSRWVERLDKEGIYLDSRCMPSIIKVQEAWIKITNPSKKDIYPLQKDNVFIQEDNLPELEDNFSPSISTLENKRNNIALLIKSFPIEKQEEIMFCFDYQDVVLDLSNLSLEKLDRDFFKSFPFIKHLDLSNNQLSEIPDLTMLDNLEYLNVENNNLEILDIPTECSKLHTLIATGNNLTSPPNRQRNSLEHCLWKSDTPDHSNKPDWRKYIKANENSDKVFQALNECLFNQTPVLRLSHMQISNIDPEIFKYFSHICELDLSYNNIVSFTILKHLPKLKKLDLTSNSPLRNINIEDKIHLKEILLQNNSYLESMKMNFLYLENFLGKFPAMEYSLTRILLMQMNLNNCSPTKTNLFKELLYQMNDGINFIEKQCKKNAFDYPAAYVAFYSAIFKSLQPWIKKSLPCILEKKEILKLQKKLDEVLSFLPKNDTEKFHNHKLFWNELFLNIKKIPECPETIATENAIIHSNNELFRYFFCNPKLINYPIQPIKILKFSLPSISRTDFSTCNLLLSLSIKEEDILDCFALFSKNDMLNRGQSIALYFENTEQKYSIECRLNIAKLLAQNISEYFMQKEYFIRELQSLNILETSEHTTLEIKKLAKYILEIDCPDALKILNYLQVFPSDIMEINDANFIKDLLLCFQARSKNHKAIIEHIQSKFPEIFNDLEFLKEFIETLVTQNNLYFYDFQDNLKSCLSTFGIARLNELQRRNLAKILVEKSLETRNVSKHINPLEVLQKDEFIQEITCILLKRPDFQIESLYELGIENSPDPIFKTQTAFQALARSPDICKLIVSDKENHIYSPEINFIKKLIDLSNEENLAKVVKILQTHNKDIYPILFGKLLNYTNITYYATIILDGNWSSVDKDKILKELLFYPDKLMQEFLFKSLLSLEKNQEFNECFYFCSKVNKIQKSNKDSKLSSDKILASIIIAKWMAQEHIKEPPIYIQNLLNNARALFHDPKDPYLRGFLKMTQAIDSSLDFSNAVKLQIVNFCTQILPEKISKGEKSRLDEFSLFNSLVNCCIRCDSALVIEALSEPDLFADNLKKQFTKWIRENLIDETLITELTTKYQASQTPLMISYEDAYLNLSSSMRVSGALEAYIPNAEKAGILDVFQLFISSVLTKTFYQVRYDIDRSNHLRFLNDNAPEVLQKWKTENFKQVIHFANSENTKEIPLIDFFRDKLSHRHWHINEEDLLPRLTTYINEGQVPAPTEENTTWTSIEDQCIELLKQSVNLIQKNKIEKIREIIALTENKGIELCNDLKSLLPSTIQNLSEIIMIISDDPQDLYLSGTEVAGSCQRVDGNPNLCKCLMAYCLDGKIKMLLIKHPITEKILARRAMRLLWDNTTGKPAIFLSRLYTAAGIKDQVDSDLISAAKIYAEKLGVSMFVQGYENSHILESFGSSAPFEYVDEIRAGNTVSYGKFTVSGVSV